MAWRIEYTKRFLKDLARLPKEIRNQVEEIVFEEIDNPFKVGYIE